MEEGKGMEMRRRWRREGNEETNHRCYFLILNDTILLLLFLVLKYFGNIGFRC